LPEREELRMAAETNKPESKSTSPPPRCGIVMPISTIDSCSDAHWLEVKEILNSAAEDAGFEPLLVSEADDIGIIQKRIIENLYENPIVVCDVSAKNPNVMFELGLRLAFDKPTIVVKDDKTDYSFDTGPIEHLDYPRDLRFQRIVDFKKKLAHKIRATHEKANTDKSYTTFLKNFGEFTVAKIDKKEIPSQEFIIEELQNLSRTVRRLEFQSRPLKSTQQPTVSTGNTTRYLTLTNPRHGDIEEKLKEISSKGINVKEWSIFENTNGTRDLEIEFESPIGHPQVVDVMNAIGSNSASWSKRSRPAT
jgi:hypothetical protein